MLNNVLERLSGVKTDSNGHMARCPAHDDQKQSLSISTGKTGNVLLKCHAGCEYDKILNAVGLRPADLFPIPTPRSAVLTRDLTTYDYCDEAGRLLFQAVRKEPKGFFQRRPNGNGWTNSLNGTRRVLYRLPELLKADRSFPVFIVEGEKDVDNLRSIGVSATCNPLGAGKWQDQFSESLAGFKCVILPDNDQPGELHAATVAKSLLIHAVSVDILRLPDLPDKGDVSDWISKGNTSEDLFALLSGAETISPDSTAVNDEGSAPDLPTNFVIDERGVFYCGVAKNGEPTKTFVCSPLRVTAKTCDADNEGWGRRLQFEDAQHVKHDLVIPMTMMSGDGSELRSRLMDCGLIIDPGAEARQKFLRYLLTSEPVKHVRCVNQLGWHGEAFVLPDEVISANGDRDSLFLQNVDRTANKFKANGSLTDWQENIGRYCVGNSRLMFAVSVAFAASLLPIAEDTGGGFHLIGTSSIGKTTALFVAGSVWGGRSTKGFLDTWKSTGNGLEAVAEMHNHSLLLLDEINEVNAYEVGEIVYALSNGFGKSRMNKNTTARRKAEWNLLFISSGEETLEQKMNSVGQRTRGGQQARFVNIEADTHQGLGLYENLHGFESANALADHLSTVSRKVYGSPIRKFLQAVCHNRKLVESRIKESRQMFQSKLRLQDASGEVFRVASRFSLVTVAGILASEFGVTNWSVNDVISCGERLFDEWLDQRGTTGSYDVDQGVRHVLLFIAEHGSSRFQPIEAKRDFSGNEITERVHSRAGFKRKDPSGQTEYLILPEIFEGEICKGFSAGAVAKELDRRGHLRRGREKECLQTRVTLPELGRGRVYVVVNEGLESCGDQER